ncbi:diacylglycerol diphosphate phosphatase / phosphatidate phosphatase [Marchantia polymorpha subsp. ruderalis]|uniref:Phosphatidic acid phosphatase type 2/haloperoxidase domain-containing protein n=1 Tax=Marchantia polymorpha TaxID=3197 RepID=A0A2R6VZX4_MARPO|nr:hypothetical protein MARPO_0216s0003 [Marchantia polymorpha]BBN18676.1 hypothetical protein Mp_8g04470 [Marchantia polymorpha subsp. ruderalis]|eukprot:PTQ27158.1 hypothetical protein MARPO_0216s0003 [Marchantia polymorpha]
MGNPEENRVNVASSGVPDRGAETLNQPLRGAELPPIAREGQGTDISTLALLKYHLKDWLMVVIIAGLEIVVYVVIPPFHRYVGEDIIENYEYPRKDFTVPTWSVLVIAVFIPLAVFFAYFLKRRSVRDFHNAFLGLGTAIALTALLTDSIKNTVGMPRPDFFWRCFPDGVPEYQANKEVLCHGVESDIKDGYKSFPSGHASWCFAGLGYLSLYLAAKFGIFDKRGRTLRIFWVLLPLLAATLISISRVCDYQHRWEDIIFGALLGIFVAYLCYRQHFPSFYSDTAGYPYKYIPGTHGEPTGGSSERSDLIPGRQANGANDLEAGRL